MSINRIDGAPSHAALRDASETRKVEVSYAQRDGAWSVEIAGRQHTLEKGESIAVGDGTTLVHAQDGRLILEQDGRLPQTLGEIEATAPTTNTTTTTTTTTTAPPTTSTQPEQTVEVEIAEVQGVPTGTMPPQVQGVPTGTMPQIQGGPTGTMPPSKAV